MSAENESVSFRQPFGGIFHAPGFSAGTLRIREREFSERLYSPRCLYFEHDMTRRAEDVDFETQSATIVDARGTRWTYSGGKPCGESVWSDAAILVREDGSVRERFSDGREILYSPDGYVSALRSRFGAELSREQLGLDVVSDALGNVRQIWSLADGLLDVVTESASRFRVDWRKAEDVGGKDAATGLYAFSGSPAKSFTFEVEMNTECLPFVLTERRGNAFSFRYSWTYSPASLAWTFVRGSGAEAVVSRKEKTYSEDGESFTVAETVSGAAGTARVSEETYSNTADGEMLVGAKEGGIALFSSERVAEGAAGRGKIASRTNLKTGETTSYSYDERNRTTATESASFAGLRERAETAYAETSADALPDFRPLRAARFVAGTLFSEETYSYEDGNAESGAVETRTLSARDVSQTRIRRFYPLDGKISSGRLRLEARADGTATLYEYEEKIIPARVSPSTDLSFRETETRGALDENGEFVPVAGKSTRVARTFDSRGNTVFEENFVHAGTGFERVSWVARKFNPMHREIEARRSDGRISSADWICTGAVWTLDENGVRTDNVYDSTKRLVASIRRGAFGDVRTDYASDADGNVLAETKSSAGLVSQTQKTEYDGEGRVSRRTDALGRATHYFYSDDGLTTTVRDPEGGTTVSTRNADGTLASVAGTAVAAARYYSYAFDAENALKITTVHEGAPDSARWEKTYADGLGRTVKTERPDVGGNGVLSTEHFYDSRGLLAETRATRQPTLSRAYDALGNAVSMTQSVIEAPSSEHQASGIETGFLPSAKTSAERLALSAWRKTETETVFEKDESGVVWQKTTQTVSCSDETIPARTSVSKTQLSGLTLARIARSVSTDVRGNASESVSSLDPAKQARETRSRSAGVSGERVERFTDGKLVETVEPGGVVSRSVYDAFGRRIRAIDARGNATDFLYDASDALVRRSQTLDDGQIAATSFRYDGNNRLSQTIAPDGASVLYERDLRGNVICEHGTAAYPVRFSYDAFGQRVALRTYRAASATRVPADDAGDETRWTYDEATGVLLSKTDALGNTVSYSYDAETLALASRTWARGVETVYAYDAWNQLVSTTYSDGTPSVSREYDALGRLVAVTDASGTTAYRYDEYGDLVEETKSDGLFSSGKTIQHHFDRYGRDLGYSIDGARRTRFSYESETGRLTRASLLGSAFAWEYLAGTRLKARLIYPGDLTTEYAYERSRELLASVSNVRAGEALSRYDYENDAVGRRAAMKKSGAMTSGEERVSYGYDTRSQVISARSDADEDYAYAYDFDSIGNRLSSSEAGTALAYSANALNQYVSMGERSGRSDTLVASAVQSENQNDFSSQSDVPAPQGVTAQSASSSEATGVSLLPFSPGYDADGNMTLIQTSTGTWSVSYNAENRPVTWTNSAGEKICMIYDSRGRRAEKRVFNAAGTRTLRERYVYVGYTCVQVLDGDDGNAVVKEFAWNPTEPVATKPLFMFLPQARLSLLYTHDGNKNVSDACYLAPQNGVGAHYEYAPFGALTRVSKNTRVTVPDVISENPFRFSSEYFDDELGLVYYNFRHYSPTLGRFLSRDPIEENGGWNLYAYVRNQSVSETDILGKVCCVIIAHPGNYPGDRTSSVGHAILDCGDDGYLSFFPQKADGNKVGIGTFPGINHDREDDEKQYGISDELWGFDNVIILRRAAD